MLDPLAAPPPSPTWEWPGGHDGDAFDPYRGHSWAAGLAPFADGNNQADDAAAAFAARSSFDDGWSKALALAWVAAVQGRDGTG